MIIDTNAGIDWVTVTNKIEGQYEIGLVDAFKAVSAGNHEDWYAGGYKGTQCGTTGIKYGSRTNKERIIEELLVLPGSSANLAKGAGIDLSMFRCTRVDIQATLTLESEMPKIAQRAYQQMVRMKELGTGKSGRRKLTLMQGDKGDTLYVGSRKTKSFMFRFYDKSGWFDAPRGTVWRQEIQFGRAASGVILEAALRSDEEDIHAVVVGYYDRYTAGCLFSEQKTGIIRVEPSMEIPEITQEKRIKWLKRCVRPVVQRMLQDGYGHAALNALGLLGDGHMEEDGEN